MSRFSSTRARTGIIGLLLTAGACTTEYVSPVPFERAQLLGATDTRWVIIGRVTTYNGRPFDVYASSDTCTKDNYRILQTDSVLMWRRGRRACSPIDPDTVLGHWEMSRDYQSLTLQNDPDLAHETYRISQLNDSIMVLKWNETTANGTALGETVTLKLQD